MKIFIVTDEGYYTGLSYQVSSRNIPHNATSITPPKIEEGQIAKFLFDKQEWIVINSEDRDKYKEDVPAVIDTNSNNNNITKNSVNNTDVDKKIDELNKLIEEQKQSIYDLGKTIEYLNEQSLSLQKQYESFCNDITNYINSKLDSISSNELKSIKSDIESLKKKVRFGF